MYYENYENVVAQKNNEQKYILKELPTQPICIISVSSVTNSSYFISLQHYAQMDFELLVDTFCKVMKRW